MPEILTESFCERCGTRYTFESVAPRKTKKLGQFKTLGRGMKNWVMSDDSSLDEAMAAARSDEEREATAQQLDAFHATFNFCMSCRQYTCSNCWNAAEGHCLSCAPHLGHEILPAPFPETVAFEPAPVEMEAWPEVDLPGVAADLGLAGLAATNGAHQDLEDGYAESNGAVHDEPEFDAAARLAFLAGDTPSAPEAEIEAAEPVEDVAIEPELEAVVAADELIAEPGAFEEPVAVEEPVAFEEPVALAAEELAEELAPEPVAFGEIAPVADADAPLAAEVDSRAAEGAARTSDLLARFRPGQNIDAELAAFEAELEAGEAIAEEAELVAEAPAAPVAASAEPELAWPDEPVAPAPAGGRAMPSLAWGRETESEPAFAAPEAVVEPAAEPVYVAEPEPEPQFIADEAEPEPIAATPEPFVPEPEPEPVAVEPEPEPVAAAPEPEPEPVAAVPEPEPAPAPVREDRIEQPTWRIFAPDPTATPGPMPAPPGAPGPAQIQASAEPQWPARPDIEESPSMALLANRAVRSSSDDLWAASAREVMAPVGETAPTAGIQPCSNCGLSLSSTARFCRRCGTRQG
jgi:hypothetical protein